MANVDLGRLRRGEVIAALGGLLLLIALFFFDWYSGFKEIPVGPASTAFGAWDSAGFLGFVADLVILAAALAAVSLAVLTATSRTIALPVAASAVTASLGIAAVAMILLRMVFQPGSNAQIDLKFGILLALIAALIVAYGGWDSMNEEGTTFESARDQLRSRYARRPAPPAGPTGRPEADAPDRDESRPPPTA
jgi:hypothetical protein